jgi:hypothetical protein
MNKMKNIKEVIWYYLTWQSPWSNDKIYIILDNHHFHISKYTKEELKKIQKFEISFPSL